MNIFEFAMKLEKDGREYYLEHAEKEVNPTLKEILLELADDELGHFETFKALHEGLPAQEIEASISNVPTSAKNLFENLKLEAGFTASADTRAVWQHALEVEKKAEDFYRQKIAEVSDPKQKEILCKIAEEEHRHWRVINNVCEFLDHPERYIEDAEWTSLEEK